MLVKGATRDFETSGDVLRQFHSPHSNRCHRLMIIHDICVCEIVKYVKVKKLKIFVISWIKNEASSLGFIVCLFVLNITYMDPVVPGAMPQTMSNFISLEIWNITRFSVAVKVHCTKTMINLFKFSVYNLAHFMDMIVPWKTKTLLASDRIRQYRSN